MADLAERARKGRGDGDGPGARAAPGRGRPGPRTVRRTGRRALADPRYFALSARMEAVLIQAVVALGLVVVLSQVLLTIPAARYVMSQVARLEGVALWEETPTVTIALRAGSPGRAAAVLVNGERAATFASDQVRLRVRPGDLLEVDGTGLDGEGVFEVVETTGGLRVPALGERVVTRGGVRSLGRVEVSSGGGGD